MEVPGSLSLVDVVEDSEVDSGRGKHLRSRVEGYLAHREGHNLRERQLALLRLLASSERQYKVRLGVHADPILHREGVRMERGSERESKFVKYTR